MASRQHLFFYLLKIKIAILWVEKFVEEGRIRTMGITHSPAQRYDELIANCD